MNEFEKRARDASEAVRRQLVQLPEHDEEGLRRVQRPPSRRPFQIAVAASILVGAVAIGVPVVRSGDITSDTAGTSTGGGAAASGAESGGSGSGGGAASGGVRAAFPVPGALTPFPSCDSALRYFHDRAPDELISRVGAVTDTDRDVPFWRRLFPSAQSDSAASGAGGSEAQASDTAHSDTNVQEAGVDEPDIVKTDGQRIVAVAQGRVHLITSVRGKLTRAATLPGSTARNVFLSGDRLLVFGDPSSGEGSSAWVGATSVLTMYDLSSLTAPQLVATLTIDGTVLDARLVGSQIRVVSMAVPDVDAPSPTFTSQGRLTEKSERKLREAVAKTTIENWIPSYVLSDGAGRQLDQGLLVDCADLARPAAFSGIDTVAVTSLSMDSALQSHQAVGVVAGGEQIYATGTATYVASTEWKPDGAVATTSLHKFVTAASGASTYRGSGEVPGTLLNQYALSEYEGVLRVASTVTDRRGWASQREVTEGVVTTLRETDGTLSQVGQIGGLGREDNESIHAVRFLEDRGYVVTFRQTDPLYVLDLTEPRNPTVLGELKIPGYSGYLHPVGENLLLGVGQSGATAGGQPGVQFSLFDISDPASPRRVGTRTYGAGAAGAEFDPKAFLYWEPRDLVVAPLSLYGDGTGQGFSSGVVLLRTTATGLTELGMVPVTPEYGTAHRSFVIGDDVFVLSDGALQTADLDTRRPIDCLIF